MPRSGRDLVPAGDVTAVRRATQRSWWWALALLALIGVYLIIVGRRAPGTAVTALPWILAPFLAAVGWAFAARRAEARPRTAFRVFQGAAVVGLVAHLACAYHPAGAAGTRLVSFLLLTPALVIGAGTVLAMGSRRGRAWTPRLATDTTLLVLAAIAGALRLVVEPSLGAGAMGFQEGLITVLRALAVVPVILAAQVVLRRGTVLSPWAGSLLLAATLAFALAALVSLANPEVFFTVRDASDYVEILAWLLFAGAGYGARAVPATAHAMLAGRRTPDAIRKLVVPGAALFMAVAVTDMGFGRPPRPETVVAVALLGLVLAIRAAQAFSLADRDADQRRQLAHTQALVDVTHALAGTTELDETLRVISESARAVFGTRGAGIELLTEDGTRLETRAVVGLPGDVVGLTFPLEGSFTGWVVRHEEPRATVDPSRDPFIQPQSLDFLGRWPVAAAPIQFRGQTQGALFACIRSEPFDAEELALMRAMAEQAAIAIQQARLFEQVKVLSVTDPLTGLANRRQLERELEREFAAARRGRDLSVVIFDMDGFKAFNDTHGHLAGDEALQAFARALQDETRAMNLTARYGGDEFVTLLAGTDSAGARTFVERVRIRFAGLMDSRGRGRLEVSAGTAEYAPDMELPEELLRKADDELYRVKPRAPSRG